MKHASRFFRSQSMVYSGSSAWRRQVSLIWNEFLFRWAGQREWSLLRLGLHPPDWRYPDIRKQALSAVSRATIRRSVMTYFQWMQEGGLESSDASLSTWCNTSLL